MGFTSPEVKEVIMDFDKCEEDGFEEEYNFQMNKHLTNDSLQNHFVHFDPHLAQSPGEEIIYIHDAQLHTYIINNKDPLQQQTSSTLNETLYYQQHNNKQNKQSDDDGANNGRKRTNEESQNNDTVNDEDEEDEVLIYDTQL